MRPGAENHQHRISLCRIHTAIVGGDAPGHAARFPPLRTVPSVIASGIHHRRLV